MTTGEKVVKLGWVTGASKMTIVTYDGNSKLLYGHKLRTICIMYDLKYTYMPGLLKAMAGI